MYLEVVAPDYEDLVQHLRVLHEIGSIRLCTLTLPALQHAARTCDESGRTKLDLPAIETMLKTAAGYIGGQMRESVEYFFGLVPGTRGWKPKDLRECAASLYGLQSDTYRKEAERLHIGSSSLKLFSRYAMPIAPVSPETPPEVDSMPDSLTLAYLGSTALSEGIKFLYNQADELLASRRSKKAAKQSGNSLTEKNPDTTEVAHEALSPKLCGLVEGLQTDLLPYITGQRDIDSNDRALIESAHALRRLLEVITASTLTFEGEVRPQASSSTIESEIDIDEVAGYAAAVRARYLAAGHVKGQAKVRTVLPGAQVVGVDIGLDPHDRRTASPESS